MLKIRLQRVGRKNDPSFRLVVTDSKNGPRAGKAVEVVGSYDARKGKPRIDAERVKYWLTVGAKTSATAHNLLVDAKIVGGKKIPAFVLRPKQKAPTLEEVAAPAPEPAATEAPAAVDTTVNL